MVFAQVVPTTSVRHRDSSPAANPDSPTPDRACRGRDLILDGQGSERHTFVRPQCRLHVANPTADLMRAVPMQLPLFDVLVAYGAEAVGQSRSETPHELKNTP
ncbi:hypothetical protein [Nocardia jejuensis]|uniref:hypothetical protein n=1 Tax=Nocardia jejuensis TaxID=328049 RepID=UPI000A6935A9|nr:hypothetical protein [Nocardia jejuensis]